MADYTVSGAGDASFDGDYTENGTFNGQPAYQRDGGGGWIFWESTASEWWMDTTYAPLPGEPEYRASTITGVWTVGMFGASPAPTVTEATSSTRNEAWTLVG